MALTNKLSNIADAIRTKNGTSAKLSLDDMASSILAIESGSGSGNVDVGSYHVWYKNTLPNIIVEEAVGRLYVSGNSVTNKENYGTLVYSDSIEVSNGRVVLINPTTISNATNGAIDGVIQGKYIKQTNTIYRVPSDSIVGTTSFNTTTRVYVDDLYELSVSGEKGNFIEFVFSKTSNTYPTDGEQGDNYYVYKGIVSDEVADPLLQSKTVTPSGEVQTIKPDTDYDGLSQVTVKAIDSIDTSDATATADDIIYEKTAYVNGEKITGNIVRYNGTTYTPTTEDEWFPAGAYNSKIIVKGDANLLPENIRQGVSIFNVEGTLSPYDDTDSTATAENIESGYTAYVKGERITGSLESGVQANLLANSTTYSNEGSVKYSTSTGTSDINSPSCFTVSYKNKSKRIAKVNDKISANVRASLFGNATVNDVVKGKTFSSENGLKLTGTYEGSAATLQEKTVTPSESSQTVTSDSGYDGLSQVTVDAISSTYIGSGVTKKSAATYTPGTSDQTIVSGQYLNGTQTIKGDPNLVAGNIKSGVSIFGVSGSYVGSGGSSGGLVMKTGTTTSATIETGLSSIKMLVIYTDSFSSTGFIQGTYVTDEGLMHYTYCSSYSSYMKVCGVTTSTSCTVDGGTFTLNTSHELISGKTYNWIAVGEA